MLKQLVQKHKALIIVNEEIEEIENKVNIEKAAIQLSIIKEELNDELDCFGEIDRVESGKNINEPRQEREITMDEFNEIKQEIQNNFDEVDHGTTLTHILNSTSPPTNIDWKIKSLPTNILEIKQICNRYGVFALKTIPKDIKFGPFDGVMAIERINGFMWKIKDGKLTDVENGNWMQYVACAMDTKCKNLEISQCDGNLYFRTNREIKRDEELLICYCEGDMQRLNEEDDEIYVLVKEERDENVFACTFCGLGFSLDKCLFGHKARCPYSKNTNCIPEIMQCSSCKIWMEKREYFEYHMAYCLEVRYPRLANFSSTGTNHQNEIPPSKQKQNTKKSIRKDENESISERIHKCPLCSYRVKHKRNLKTHAVIHDDVKPFECQICNERFNFRRILKLHIKDKHAQTDDKEYKCLKCPFQTNERYRLKNHLETHTDILSFECDICNMRFKRKMYLKKHQREKHRENNIKDFKCTMCPYETNYKIGLTRHLNTHNDVKPFECEICNVKFTDKANLKTHINLKHPLNEEKLYKCTQCSFETNYKRSIDYHEKVHTDIRSYQCHICAKTFIENSTLQFHIKNKHKTVKRHKCPQCTYETNIKMHLENHLISHSDVKQFICDICDIKFALKSSLRRHIKDKHLGIVEKVHKCSYCPYQTNYKWSFGNHVLTHSDYKRFQCDVCELTFRSGDSLKTHVRNKHVEKKVTIVDKVS